MPIDNVINQAVNAGRWVVMQHEEGTIITGRANIPKNVTKAGHVETFCGRHSQAVFFPRRSTYLFNVGRGTDGAPHAAFALNSKTGNGNVISAHRKRGESADLYE
jgi:hypothetical protein